jgi:hypothetical protein
LGIVEKIENKGENPCRGLGNDVVMDKVILQLLKTTCKADTTK